MSIAPRTVPSSTLHSWAIVALSVLALAGCELSSSDDRRFSVGGSIGGLTAEGLVLANGNETLSVSSGSTQFTFSTPLSSKSAYAVTIQSEVSGLTCSVANATGSIGLVDVSDVAVTCAKPSYSLGGTASGVTRSGLVLANNGETLSVSAGAASFVFATPVASGAAYAVSVQSAPAGLICSVANGTGDMGTANANNVVVTCAEEAHSLSGTISGLTQLGLVLANGTDHLALSAGATTFTLPTPIATTSSYAVTVATQPNGLACAVTGGAGTMGTSDVTGIAVTCTNRDFTLSGTVSGLISSGLVLAYRGELLAVPAHATSFLFATPVTFATTYVVTVATHPAGMTCSVSSGTGMTPAANVTDVAVVCSAQSYNVGGTITGLTRAGLVLANGSDTLPVSANATTFTLPTAVAFGATYSVTVTTQPTNMTCSVGSGSGTMPASAVTNVTVACSVTAYTLGGTISGLTAGGLILANGADRLSVAANATLFSMPTGLAIATVYNLTVAAQPAGRSCSVTNGSGTMPAADVSNVQIACVARQWAWVKGLNTAGGNGNYGSKGVAAVGNVPPPRNSAHTWIDAAGNLWLFGGAGRVSNAEGDLNDLWKYDPITQLWTWTHGSNSLNVAGNYGTQGVAASSNEPRSRHEGITWIDANGKFWLFGGYSDAPGVFGTLNDLWRYDPTTNQWTWIAGSSSPNAASVRGTLGVAAPGNVPGARLAAVSWLDSTGRFWLFGGRVHPINELLNDIWSYDPTTQWWTWQGGSSSANVAGIHGTRGVAAPGNAPGARQSAMGATNGVNQLLLFGGGGYDSAGTNAALNDLWSWDLTTHQWTWLSGSTTSSAAGVYGTQGLPAASNTPGARYSALSWVDSAGRYWMFGGYGANASGNFNDMNDLWMYDLSTQQWIWVNGSSSGNTNGVYGTVNVPAPSNSPGGRLVPSGWIDANNRIWVFGGYGRDSVGSRYKLSDLWMY
jgi:N-acetylneuraminic acid mutarotase